MKSHLTDEEFEAALEKRFPKWPYHYERKMFGSTAKVKIAEIEHWLGYPMTEDERAQVKDGPQLWDKAVPGPTLCMSYRRRVDPNATKTLPAVSSMQLFTIRYTL